MPKINPRNQLPMAVLGKAVGAYWDEKGNQNPAPLDAPQEGYLTSRELFLHVLALTWGDMADYDKEISDRDIDAQWADATKKISEAIGDGSLSPYGKFAANELVKPITLEQWPQRPQDWWESSLFEATIIHPFPDALKDMVSGTLCFEIRTASFWLSQIEKIETSAPSYSVKPPLKQNTSPAEIERAFRAKFEASPKDEKFPSREENMEWCKANFGKPHKTLIEKLRKKWVPAEMKKRGRPSHKK